MHVYGGVADDPQRPPTDRSAAAPGAPKLAALIGGPRRWSRKLTRTARKTPPRINPPAQEAAYARATRSSKAKQRRNKLGRLTGDVAMRDAGRRESWRQCRTWHFDRRGPGGMESELEWRWRTGTGTGTGGGGERVKWRAGWRRMRPLRWRSLSGG